jgi:flagellar hook-associated protein 2
MASRIEGLNDEQYNQLYAIGIRTGVDGKLAIKDSARFEEALKDHLDDIIKLFADSGSSSNSYIEFDNAGAAAKIGEGYEVDITQAASKGYFQGAVVDSPATSALVLTSTNNRLKFKIDGLLSNEITLTEKTYSSSDELVTEIQNKIDADEKIGGRGLSVSWVDAGSGQGFLRLSSSLYGSSSSVEMESSQTNSAFTVLGLSAGTRANGNDVAGTINGEEAEGKGQYLTGKEGNETTDGLRLKVKLDSYQVDSGIEGTLSVAKGVGARLEERLLSYTKSTDGLISRRVKGYEGQVKSLTTRIAEIDERLVLRRDRLMKQWQRLEEVLGQMNAQSTFLNNGLQQVNANWNYNA